MNTIRFKVFVSFVVLLLLFLACMVPFVTNSVQHIVVQSMNDRADELIDMMQEAQDEESLVQAVKDQSYLVFFHVGLIDEKLQIVYDSHNKRLLGSYVVPVKAKLPPEVSQAIEEGIGYSESYTPLLGQKLFYLAKSFDFHGKNYIIRLAFPHEYIEELKKNFNFGFFFFSSLVLVLFSVITGLILYHFMSPVRQIIRAIKPYQEGKASSIPEIHIRSILQDEFFDLAETFNLLSERIKHQIETLTHERNEKESILEALAEGVLAVDSKMHISYANSMALGFLGLDRDVIGKPFPSSEHQKCYDLLLRTTNQTEANYFNDSLEIIADGKKLHLNVVASARQNKSGAILVLQDKSIHYKILEMRKDFIANASHELKTPITIIRGFAETLQDNPDLDKQIVHDITEKIVRNSHRMTKIIKNLLTLADIENLPLFRLQSYSLLELAQNCAQTVMSMHSKVSVVFNTEGDNFFIDCDVELLEVALMNLLDNAAKYSKDNPQIIISLQRLNTHTKLSVKDKGIGIPEVDIEHIFQRFYTVNKLESKKMGGSGLGLSIVETIVEKHCGKIYVDSAPMQGSTFTMLLPNELASQLQLEGTMDQERKKEEYVESRRQNTGVSSNR